MAEQLKCPYKNTVNATKPCEYVTTNIKMLLMHKRGDHNSPKKVTNIIKEVIEKKVKDEVRHDTKKSKKFERKPVKFCEGESREEFRRKKAEFKSYQERTDIKGEDIADDLYRSCEMPLKRKLVTLSLICENVKQTDPTVMMDKIERLCLPRVNKIMERDQFR